MNTRYSSEDILYPGIERSLSSWIVWVVSRKWEIILLIIPGLSCFMAKVDAEIEEEDGARVEVGDIASGNPEGMVQLVELNPDSLPQSPRSFFRS